MRSSNMHYIVYMLISLNDESQPDKGYQKKSKAQDGMGKV